MGAIRGFIGPLWKKFLQKIGAEAVEQGGMSTANKEVSKWMGAEGGEQYLKNRAAEQGMKEWGEEAAKSGTKSGGSGVGRTILSVAIGVGTALAFPGVGFAGQLVMGLVAEKGGEAAVGAVINNSAPSKPAAPDTEDEAQVTGMVPDDDGSTVQRQNGDPGEAQPSEPDPGPFVGGTTTGTTPHEGTSTTTTTTTTEESTSTHEEPHEPPPPAYEDPHDDFDD